MDVEQLIVNMHTDLASKVDAGFTDLSGKFAAHEVLDAERFGKVGGELKELQNTRTTLRWFIGVVVVAILGAAVEHVMNHRVPDPSTPVHAEETHKR